MEIKKTSNADLERMRPKTFLLGLVVAVIVFFATLELSFHESDGDFDSDFLDEIAEDMEFMPPLEENLPMQEQLAPVVSDQIEVVEQAESVSENEEVEEAKQQPDIVTESEVEEEKVQETVEEQPVEEEKVMPMGAVDELPQYPGGMAQLLKWLTAHLKYPESAKAAKISGKVIVAFIVNADGTVSDVKLVKGADPSLDNEALRVIRTMPKWQPGRAGGRPCRTLVHLPVVYKL